MSSDGLNNKVKLLFIRRDTNSENTSKQKRDQHDVNHGHDSAGGFNYNYCFLHPEHHLTIQYDWNDILGAVDSHIGDMVAHYDINFGDVDMNDTVEGGWKVLMGTGKLVVESSTSFGSNFETCDRDTFDGLAK